MGSAQLSLLDTIDHASVVSPGNSTFGPAPIPDHFSSADRKQAESLLDVLWSRCEQAMKNTVEELWYQKYHHYTDERLLIRNISKRVMVEEDLIQYWRTCLDWPGVSEPHKVLPRKTAWRTIEYVDEDDNLVDPLESFVKRVFRTSKHQALWGRYCRSQGVLLPEDIRTDDIRYVLHNAPICQRAFYRLFHQEPYGFARYIDYLGLDLRQLGSRSPKLSLTKLVVCHPRIRDLVARYAQAVYTNRGIPISVIAERLELDPVTLWSIGDQRTPWQLPTQSTLNHLINESVLRSFF